ncbi:MAG: HAD-IIIC family phosphatase [Lachnospiraceae bacterium]|nr:HAD-IIIC family phosphatase [Lachnospiraceae bacterium]
MKELEYPFDADYIVKKARRLRKELLADGTQRIEKRIAVLGGATTHDVVRVLELFLLHHGIAPVFYESEYNRFREDALFPEEEFASFQPDVIYLHTCLQNIREWPLLSDDAGTVQGKLDAVTSEYVRIWEALKEKHHCAVIQDNFVLPSYRLLGNRDASDVHGRVNFVDRLNAFFAEYAATHEGFYLQDVRYIAACYGQDAWCDPSAWYLYKYAQALSAVPYLAHNLANMIKSVFGKNKKALVLDLDNTLWGGVVGDDGKEGIEIGEETATAEAYTAFQRYIKAQKDIGIVLNVASKNTEDNARAGLTHPDSVLAPEDFLYLQANWDPKSDNVMQIAKGMNIGTDAIVFVDDNPAEREIVTANVPGVAAPALTTPEHYIRDIDRAGYFEVTNLSEDDRKRVQMYRENAERMKLEESFTDYHAYLLSLEMQAEIAPFAPVYYERISQLTNKSNQYNLTTKRFTVEEIKAAAEDPACITLYGRLKDKFGDNGVVALLIARVDSASAAGQSAASGQETGIAEQSAASGGEAGVAEKDVVSGGETDAAGQGGPTAEEGVVAHIELFLMSCRVLKRDMEVAMMDALYEQCRARGIKTMYGTYIPTAKNGMVADFYKLRGFTQVESETATGSAATAAAGDEKDAAGNGGTDAAAGATATAAGSTDAPGTTRWRYDIPADWQPQCDVIEIAGAL